MTENTEEQNKELQTTKKQSDLRKPDGVMAKIDGKTFVTEIFFNHNSKDTFQDKLLKVIRSEQTE